MELAATSVLTLPLAERIKESMRYDKQSHELLDRAHIGKVCKCFVDGVLLKTDSKCFYVLNRGSLHKDIIRECHDSYRLVI